MNSPHRGIILFQTLVQLPGAVAADGVGVMVPAVWPIRGEHCGHVTSCPPITAHLTRAAWRWSRRRGRRMPRRTQSRSKHSRRTAPAASRNQGPGRRNYLIPSQMESEIVSKIFFSFTLKIFCSLKPTGDQNYLPQRNISGPISYCIKFILGTQYVYIS